MSEWSNVPVSKTGEQQCSGGSNPPLCAKKRGGFSYNNLLYVPHSLRPQKKEKPLKCGERFFVIRKVSMLSFVRLKESLLKPLCLVC